MGSATTQLAENLSAAILNQNDLDTVREGAPAYLLLIDGLIEEQPDNISRLLTGARLYSAYASIFVENEHRAKLQVTKAFEYGKRALCLQNEALCLAFEQSFDNFQPVLATSTQADIAVMYGFASAWISLVQLSNSDWNVIADLPKISAIMQRIVVLEESYDQGGAHLYLGVLATQLPPNMGGKPELGRIHFERAIELSQGKNLMVKVLFAKRYARLLYNRDLHDRLLNDVRQADARVPGLTLINTLAKQEAQALLESADEYF